MAVVTALITSGQSLSAAADLAALQLNAIAIPAAWDNADLTFQVSPDAGVTFYDFFFGGQFTELVLPVQAGKIYSVAWIVWPKNIQIKARSGRIGITVNQTANRTISFLTA